MFSQGRRRRLGWLFRIVNLFWIIVSALNFLVFLARILPDCCVEQLPLAVHLNLPLAKTFKPLQAVQRLPRLVVATGMPEQACEH